MYISIICPTYNEANYISQCIDSIVNSDIPKDLIEVIFVDGNSTDDTVAIIKRYIAKYSYIKVINNPEKEVSYALNYGIRASKGDYIIRLDAHAFYPCNYFSVLISQMNDLNADNVGGVCETMPADSSISSKAIATALSSKFGMGNSYFRVGVPRTQQVDTVPFGCFRRSIFDKIGYFDTDLIRNQDDEFNGRIIKNGGKIFLLPNLKIQYYARNSIGKTFKMFYQYGLFKPLVNRKLGFPATIRQFVPMFFVFGLLIGALLSIVYPLFSIVYLSILTIYFFVSLWIGYTKTNSMGVALIMPLVFLSLHLGYGLGYIKGLYLFLLMNKNKHEVLTNR